MGQDVFLSHASEDKTSFAEPLYTELTGLGMDVWMDEFKIDESDSLPSRIDEGLLKSTTGATLLSHTYFTKDWARAEFDAILMRDIEKDSVIIPILHHMSFDDLKSHSPLVCTHFMLNSDAGPKSVAEDISKIIKGLPLGKRPFDRSDITVDTTPLTLRTLVSFLSKHYPNSSHQWGEHGSIAYQRLRRLNVHLIGQLREALEDEGSQKELSEIYHRLLGRDKVDVVGSVMYQPIIFFEGIRGAIRIEQHIRTMPEFKKRN